MAGKGMLRIVRIHPVLGRPVGHRDRMHGAGFFPPKAVQPGLIDNVDCIPLVCPRQLSTTICASRSKYARHLRHTECAHTTSGIFFRDEHVRLPQLPDDLFRLVIPLRRSRPLEEKSIRRVGPLHWGGSVSNTSPNVRIDTVHAVQP